MQFIIQYRFWIWGGIINKHLEGNVCDCNYKRSQNVACQLSCPSIFPTSSPQTSDDIDDDNLQLLLMVTDLLATCTVGENTATESICWTVFTVEELLEILNRPESEIPLYRKRPFVRFLVWVYMNAGGSVMQKGASYLSHSKYVPNTQIVVMVISSSVFPSCY